MASKPRVPEVTPLVTGTKLSQIAAAVANYSASDQIVGVRSGTTDELLSYAQLNAGLAVFGTAAQGVVPASGGGTTNFLRADGTWAAPPGGGGITIGTTTIAGGASGSFEYNNAGVMGERTPTQVTAALNVFTTALQGLTPASGGGTTNFLRADGTWAVPPAGGSGITGGTIHGIAITNAATTIASNIVLPANNFLVGVASADPVANTPAQVAAILPVFSTTTAAQGVVPGSSGAAATSFLNATGAWSVPAGGGGAPGGSTTQVQYNNAGAFGGISNVTTNGTSFTEADINASSSSSTFVVHGSAFTSTGININSSGNILLGGDGSGVTIDISSSLGVRGNSIVQTVPAIVFTDTAGVARATSSWWDAGTSNVSGIIEQRFTTVPQTYRVYNTTDVGATNYERGVLDWTTTGNTLTIGVQAAGTGSSRPVTLTTGTLALGFAPLRFEHTTLDFYNSTFALSGGLGAYFQLTNSWSLAWGPGDAHSTPDVGFSRVAVGVLAVGNGSPGDKSGRLQTAALQASGTVPTGNTGTCATGVTVAGGATAGTWTSTAICSIAGTIILTAMPTMTTGYACSANDRTTAAVVLQQTASSTTSATFTVRSTATAANDVISYSCIGY